MICRTWDKKCNNGMVRMPRAMMKAVVTSEPVSGNGVAWGRAAGWRHGDTRML